MTTIQPLRITPERFRPYGKVVQPPSSVPTAADDTFSFWSDLASYYIEGDTEIGLCTVFRREKARVTWMERHGRTPELLIPIDAPFILPVVETGAADQAVDAFRVDPGEAVVIAQGVWHSACHPFGRDQATYFVIFRRGTPRDDVEKKDVDVVLA
jgi:ureidoglycolate hydrolase